MTNVTQSVSFEVECSAVISAVMKLQDYGVPRSPSWYESDDHYWGESTVDIAGITVALKSLPKALQNALWEYAYPQIDENKWERDDE